MFKLLRRVPLNSLKRVNKSFMSLRRVTSEGSINFQNFSSLPQRVSSFCENEFKLPKFTLGDYLNNLGGFREKFLQRRVVKGLN